MANRRDNLLKRLRSTLKECGVDRVLTDNGDERIEGFIIDEDDGTNYGDNIVVTAKEFLEYIVAHKGEKTEDDDASVD